MRISAKNAVWHFCPQAIDGKEKPPPQPALRFLLLRYPGESQGKAAANERLKKLPRPPFQVGMGEGEKHTSTVKLRAGTRAVA
jgi:hypothetical protein